MVNFSDLRQVVLSVFCSRMVNNLFLVAFTFLFASCWNMVHAMICSSNPNTAIPDGSGSATPGATVSVFITVPATYINPITDLDFLTQINHTYVGDLIVTLTSPLATTVTLIDRPGRPPATFGCSGNNINATMDDEAVTLVENQCAGAVPTISGTHRPNASLTAFDGQIPAGVWRIDVTDNAGQDTGTIISSGMCLDLTTVPVVLSQFASSSNGRFLTARWQTATEAFNLGFDLWGNIEDEWVQLNPTLVSSANFDSTSPQNYRHKIDLNALEGEVTAVGISSVSSSGEEEFFGPFAIGEDYGEESIPEVVDWTDQRQKFKQSMQAAGYTFSRGKWRSKKQKRTKNSTNQFGPILVSTSESGVYRVTYEELLASGIDLTGVPRGKIAVTHNEKGVPRIVRSATGSKRFGPGSSIIFYAKPIESETARYVGHSIYKISLNADKAVRVNKVHAPKRRELNLASDRMLTTLSVGEPKLYSFIMPGPLPWYDSPIQAYRRTAIKAVTFDIPETALVNEPVQLSMNLLGGIEFPRIDLDDDGEPEPHHHYKVYVNRANHPEPVYEGYANGFNPIAIQTDVSAQFQTGENLVEIELIPDNGLNLDAAYFIDASVSFFEPSHLDDRFLSVQVAPGEELQQIIVPRGAKISAFGFDTNGNFSKLGVRRVDAKRVLIKVPPTINPDVGTGVWVASGGGFKPVDSIAEANVPAPAMLALDDTDYVIIAHPSLIGTDLRRFSQMQTDIGRRTKIVSSQDIFDAYSDGQAVPSAISKYLREQADDSPYEYVLLVGGHTYNYRGFNHNGDENNAPLNLIPSYYRKGDSLSRQVPTAVPFVDIDLDGAPDRAIGRWPVKDLEQLRYIVDKTLAWHSEGSHKDSLSVLSIAEQAEAYNQFTPSSERLISALGTRSQPWIDIERIHLDDFVSDPNYDQSSLVSDTRQKIMDSLSQGRALTLFNGHGSPTSWGKQSLMNANVAKLLSNQRTPSILMPLACYTTYYETPYIKSLSELLLVDSNAGAAALLSPALLSRPIDNENFARRVLQSMTVKGKTIGAAVLDAKLSTHAQGGRHQSTVYNWVLLGDPTLSFNTPDITEPVPVEIPKSMP